MSRSIPNSTPYSAGYRSATNETGRTGKRSHPQHENGHPASYTYGAADWHFVDGARHQQQMDQVVYHPSKYIELNNDSHDSRLTVKRQRVEGSMPSSLTSYAYSTTSPCTSMSSDQSRPSLSLSSEGMSRQSSVASTAFANDFSMMRVGSSLSACSDPVLFPFDESEEHQLCESFVSSTTAATEVPSNSKAVTSYGDEYDVLNSIGRGPVGSQQLSFDDAFLSRADPTLDRGGSYQADVAASDSRDMSRSNSEQSDSSSCSLWSPDDKATLRLQRQVENGRRQIISKTSTTGPTSTGSTLR